MQPFRTILFAADFSVHSKEAFRIASLLAVENKTRLNILHVIEPDWIAQGPDYLGQGAIPPAETESLHEFLQRRMAELYVPSHPLKVEYRTSEGPAAQEIVRMADAIGADLIVVGTHGRTGLRRLLAGSVATAVLRGARCAVLGLRSHEYLPAANEIPVILHVAPADIYLEARFAAELDPRDYKHSLDSIREKLDGPDLKYPVETRLTRGSEADGILRIAQEVACGLIVMGTHGRTGLSRLLMGNTAESVLRKADFPVLVCKSPRGEPALTSDRAVAIEPIA